METGLPAIAVLPILFDPEQIFIALAVIILVLVVFSLLSRVKRPSNRSGSGPTRRYW
jgi:uncharacterized membrane protein